MRSVTYIRYLRDDAYQILCSDHNFPKGEICQLECFKRIIACWWVAWAVNFSLGQNKHGHEGGTIDTGCVCLWRGGGTGPSKVGTLLISTSVFTVWGTSESAEGMTLFRGIGHRAPWGGHHSYIVGVWGHLVRGMGLLVLFRYRVNQIQVIYWTQGEAGAVSESLGKRWDRGTTIAGRGTWYK